MDGLCDVQECQGLPLLGWRPLTERIGRKICEQHWRRHRDETDSFDLFEEFKFKRPIGLHKLVAKRQQSRAAVRLCMEEVLEGLPEVYTAELYQQKCDLVYQHIYDSYYGPGKDLYAA